MTRWNHEELFWNHVILPGLSPPLHHLRKLGPGEGKGKGSGSSTDTAQLHTRSEAHTPLTTSDGPTIVDC